MSSAAGQSPEFRDSSTESEKNKTSKLKAPPTRPALVSPPQRPVSSKSLQKPKSAADQPDSKPQSIQNQHQQASATPLPPSEPESPAHPQPIAPPSEPMQYRAIGLVQGTYTPDEEQFNHGNVITDDGAVIDAVLLGRVTSLVKKHIDLEKSHLWVVYPRTRRGDEDSDVEQDLHIQIVGVWEPETLGLPGEDPASKEALDQKAPNDESPEEGSDSAVAALAVDMEVETDAETQTDEGDTATEPEEAPIEIAEAITESGTTEETPSEATVASSDQPVTDTASTAAIDIPPVDDNYFPFVGRW
jgi:hypothetical protein